MDSSSATNGALKPLDQAPSDDRVLYQTSSESLSVDVKLEIDPDLELTEGAPQNWEIRITSGADLLTNQLDTFKGNLNEHQTAQQKLVTLQFKGDAATVEPTSELVGQVMLKIFACSKSEGCCMQKKLKKDFRVQFAKKFPVTDAALIGFIINKD